MSQEAGLEVRGGVNKRQWARLPVLTEMTAIIVLAFGRRRLGTSNLYIRSGVLLGISLGIPLGMGAASGSAKFRPCVRAVALVGHLPQGVSRKPGVVW